jgi:hypothetical protein
LWPHRQGQGAQITQQIVLFSLLRLSNKENFGRFQANNQFFMLPM